MESKKFPIQGKIVPNKILLIVEWNNISINMMIKIIKKEHPLRNHNYNNSI